MRRPLACLAVTVLAAAGSAVIPTAAHADGVQGTQWYLDSLGVEEAHQYAQGQGVTIGLLDSGVDASHPNLKGNIKPGKAFGDATDDGTSDPQGHGTGVASLMAGQGKDDGILGIAPAADIVSVGMHCEESQCEGAQPGMWLEDGVSWLVEQDVDIIVASTSADDSGKLNVDSAVEAGIPVVATAGNVDEDADAHLGPKDNAATAWPARTSGVIPTTGTTQDNKKWSAGQDLSDDESPHYGVAAPATDLPAATPDGHYATQSDTSLATAITAGTLALIKSAHPNLGYEQSIERLTQTTDELGESGYDDEFGWGGVHPLRALTAEVEHDDGSTSARSDILPLDEQVTNGSGSEPSGLTGSDSLAASENTAASSSPWALVLVTVGTVLAAAAITITLITLRRKRHAQVAAEREAEEDEAPQ